MSRKYFLLIFIFILSASTMLAQKGKSKPKEKTSAYDYQGPYYEGLARVKIKLKWGFIDTTGNVVVPLKYNEVTNFDGGIAKVRVGTKWGLVDNKGTVLIKPTFDAIYEFIDGKAKVLLEGEEYWMNKQGVRVPKIDPKPTPDK